MGNAAQGMHYAVMRAGTSIFALGLLADVFHRILLVLPRAVFIHPLFFLLLVSVQ
jgi:hypothetical protein